MHIMGTFYKLSNQCYPKRHTSNTVYCKSHLNGKMPYVYKPCCITGRHAFKHWSVNHFTQSDLLWFMMTSSNGSIFRVTGHLCGEFTGHRIINHTPNKMWHEITHPFTFHFPAWINNHMPSIVWDEITHPFATFKRCNRWHLGIDK